MSFRVCTYNMGANEADYLALCKYLQLPSQIETKAGQDQFLSHYATAQNKTAEILGSLADAYCFQEAGEKSRPLIASLQNRDFEIIHKQSKSNFFDCAIALNKKLFSNITNESHIFKNSDAAAAMATHTLTGQSVLFVSAHIPGFDLDAPDARDAQTGDRACEQLAALINQYTNCSIRVFGGDMNTSPELWPNRFNSFQERGFQLIRTNAATNVNCTSLKHPTRELDFIFVKINKAKEGIFSMLRSLFWASQEIHAKSHLIKPLGWDADSNASDHLPVFSNVAITTKPSLLQNLCSIFNSFVIFPLRQMLRI